MTFRSHHFIRLLILLLLIPAGPQGGRARAQDGDARPATPEEVIAEQTDDQTAAAPDQPPVAPVAPAPMPNMELLAADALAKAALARLRVNAEPGIEDFRLVALALNVAQRARENDEDLLRLELQAWLGTGDDDRVLECTRRLVRLDPRDTVATLRLLTSRLQKLQNADDRLAAYERLLGDQGASLDASIRSRLALDAALIARETGDEAGFIRRLTESVTLDSTNKDAAALYSTYFLDRTTDVRERADLLANVVLADPNDMQAHTNLARELFRRGAYVAARRFMNRAGDIAASGAVEPTVNDLFDRFLLVWMTEGDVIALESIESLRKQSLAAIRMWRARLELQGIDPGEEPEPLVPSEIEMIRLAIAWSRGDDEMMADSARNVRLRLGEQLDALGRRDPPFDKVTAEEESYYRDEAKLQRMTAHLWAGIETDSAEADLNSILYAETGNRLGPYAQLRLRGLIALRRGDTELAEGLLSGAGDDPAARLALGMLAEQRGDRNGAIRRYAALAIDHAHRLIGCAAKKRIEAMLGRPLAQTPDVRALETWSKSFAPWLDELTANPSSFMSLTVEHVRPRIDVFERGELRFVFRNVSRIPMSVGPDLSFNSRFLLSPRVIIKGEDISQDADPEALDLDRRLRLMPGESIETTIWATRGSVGLWLDRFADMTATVRWRAIQGYRIDINRRFAPGLISVTAHSDMMQRDAIVPRKEYESVVQHLATAQGRDFLEEVLRAVVLAGRQLREESDEFQARKRRALAEAIAARMPTLSSLERAWVISITSRVQLPAESRRIVDGARADPHPFVQMALIIDGYRDADDPSLIRLTEDPDPEMRAAAISARARLRGGQPIPAEPAVWQEPDEPPPSPDSLPDEAGKAAP